MDENHQRRVIFLSALCPTCKLQDVLCNVFSGGLFHHFQFGSQSYGGGGRATTIKTDGEATKIKRRSKR